MKPLQVPSWISLVVSAVLTSLNGGLTIRFWWDWFFFEYFVSHPESLFNWTPAYCAGLNLLLTPIALSVTRDPNLDQQTRRWLRGINVGCLLSWVVPFLFLVLRHFVFS